jgi:membrane protease YdiL (CAAX protease family)
VDRTLPADRRRPARHPGVSWGLGDFFSVYITGLVISLVLGSIGSAISGDEPGHTGTLTFALFLVGQAGGWILALIVVSRRKGRGSLRADFGLMVHARDVRYFFMGIGISLVLGALLSPIVHLLDNERQGVVQDLETSHGFRLWMLAVFALLIAPVCEELLFRGLLLRALRRRFSPEIAVMGAALVFALVHPLLDPSWGSLAVVPALFGLGAISGIFAVRRGDLSVSIMLHVGFNFLTVVTTVADALGHHYWMLH